LVKAHVKVPILAAYRIVQRATEMEIAVRYKYAAIGSLVWALTKGQVTGRGHLTGRRSQVTGHT